MRYLLDVNTLLALVVLEHEFHARVASWLERLGASDVPQLATCSITELGFVRVLGQAQQYGSSVAQARELLLKATRQPTDAELVLAELSALRTILVNVLLHVANGRVQSEDDLRELIEQADHDRFHWAKERLAEAQRRLA